MTAFIGTLAVQIDTDTNEEARDVLAQIVKLASGFRHVERVTVEPIERKPRETRTRRSHA